MAALSTVVSSLADLGLSVVPLALDAVASVIASLAVGAV